MRGFRDIATQLRPGSLSPVAAGERLFQPASSKCTRRTLLATTSALALVGATAVLMVGASQPAAACTIDVTGSSGAVSNAANIDCINIHGATVAGTVSNSGTLGSISTGIAISGSTINGAVADTGAIVGGIRVDGASVINSTGSGISINAVSTFAGGITNSGTITGQHAGILIESVSQFGGAISNSGTISSAFGNGIFVGGAIAHTAIAISTFAGGITNSGTISARGNGIFVGGSAASGGAVTISTFSGGISNSGTISAALQGIMVGGRATFTGGSVSIAAFSGGITNSGSITARTGILVGGAAFGPGNTFALSSFGGGILNAGTITATHTGIAVVVTGPGGGVAAMSTFAGGISNSGTIVGTLSNSVGIETAGLTTFLNGITNSGLITVGAAGAGIVVGATSFFGNVSNSGTIAGAHTGIFLCSCVNFEGGAIVNSGVISSTNAIQAHDATSAIVIDQMAGTIAGTIQLPNRASVAGTVNISGGTINGNIVGNGSSDTINFALGTGTFTYGAAYGFSNISFVNVNSGTVVLDGSSSGYNIDVNGGALAGTGQLYAFVPSTVTINPGGTLEPGTPGTAGGTLTMTGTITLVFQNGSFYDVTLSPTQHSLTAVTGNTTINGGNVVLTPTGGLGAHYSASQFAILTSTGTLSGAFNPNVGYSGSIKLSATPGLSYDPHDVFLSYADSYAILAPPPGASANQTNVANGINNVILGGASVPSEFQVLGTINGPTLLNALSSLSGEPAADAGKGASQLMNDFLDLMLDPTAGGGGGVSGGGATGFAPEQDTALPPEIAQAYAGVLKAQPAKQTFDQRWTAWGSGFGGASHTDGNATIGSNNVNASDYGFAAGMDYHLTPDTLYGFALAGGGTNWNLAQGLGSGRSDAFTAGLYAKTHWGPAYVSGALAFANHWFTTDRIAMSDQLRASFTGQSYAARLEGGYRYAVPITGAIVGVTPYAALQAQDFHTPSYSETDLTGGGFGLSYASNNATDTRSELGARFDNLQIVDGMPLVLRGRLAWAHDWFTNATALNAVFQTLPGSNFTVNGAASPKNSALTTAAAELHITSNWTAIARFDGDFGSGSQTYGGTGTLRYSW